MITLVWGGNTRVSSIIVGLLGPRKPKSHCYFGVNTHTPPVCYLTPSAMTFSCPLSFPGQLPSWDGGSFLCFCLTPL